MPMQRRDWQPPHISFIQVFGFVLCLLVCCVRMFKCTFLFPINSWMVDALLSPWHVQCHKHWTRCTLHNAIHTTEIIQRNKKNPPKELTMSNGWLQQKMLFIVITQTKNPEYTIKKVSDRTCTNREFDAVYYCTYYGYERIRTRKRKSLLSECVCVCVSVYECERFAPMK